MQIISILLALFASFTLIHANGSLPGSCLKNGTTIDPPGTVVHGGIYSSYCSSGYGRPQGVCNCISGLNSCAANLAGCPGAANASFVPPIPAVIYVGQEYEFKINISFTSLSTLCFLRPLPANLTWVQISSTPQYEQYAIFGTPTESMPSADYGVAASRGAAEGGFATFFSFEVQSCSLEDAVYPPTDAPTEAPASIPSTPSTPTAASTAPSTSCTDAQSGYTRCSGTNAYQTCDHGEWSAAQSCGNGLLCQPQGDSFIYCVRQ